MTVAEQRVRREAALLALIDKPGRVAHLPAFNSGQSRWWFIADDGKHRMLGETWEAAIQAADKLT